MSCRPISDDEITALRQLLARRKDPNQRQRAGTGQWKQPQTGPVEPPKARITERIEKP